LCPLFATSVNDTGGKFVAGVLDTGGKFAAGVVDTGGNLPPVVIDTGDKFATGTLALPPVSLILVANLRPVLLIPAAICHRCH
jgi:hypothetical protein